MPNYWRVADAIRKKCRSQDNCFSFGIGKDIDFQRGSKELSAGGGVLNSLTIIVPTTCMIDLSSVSFCTYPGVVILGTLQCGSSARSFASCTPHLMDRQHMISHYQDWAQDAFIILASESFWKCVDEEKVACPRTSPRLIWVAVKELKLSYNNGYI